METAEAAVLRAWDEYAPWARVQIRDGVVSVPVAGRQRRWTIRSWPDVPASAIGPNEVLVAANLGLKLRAAMARKGQSYADRQVLHLVHDEAIIHLEQVGANQELTDRPHRATQLLPPSGIRAVQAMLADADMAWTVRRLADEVDLSVGHAQRILSILERADLIVAQGTGAAGARRVRDRGALLDWLVQQPAARHSPMQWATHLYGRNGREVLKHAADGLSRARCVYAVTGMAAATLAELGPTELPTVHIWIDPKSDLASVAAEAGMKRTSRGANVVLWSDADRSATFAPGQLEGIRVAPPVRVYLDLLQLPRGAEVAETYRRVRLGY